MSDKSLKKTEEISLDDLTPENRLFLMLLTEGKRVYEAYQQAGYKGEKQAAYQLKSRLDKHLVLLAQAQGVSKGDLMLEIGNLNRLPVVGKDGEAVSGISMTNKIKLLGLQQKALEMTQEIAPRITAIQINRYEGEKQVEKTEIIEASHVVTDTSVSPHPAP